jgi:hypothetical protein
MPGRRTAIESGAQLEQSVAVLAEELGLQARRQVRVGRRLWGNVRVIDVVATDPTSRKTLGLECKFQGVAGTAEEKLPALIQDIDAWPIPGIVVFDGPGFSQNMRTYLHSTGKAVGLSDLEDWVRLFFGLQ